MFILVATFVIILQLISAQRVSKCCDALNNKISSASTNEAAILEKVAIIRETLGKIYVTLAAREQRLQHRLDSLTGAVFQAGSCAHLGKIMNNLSENKPCMHTDDTFESCDEALQKTGQSGVYRIKLRNTGIKPFKVYCEKTDVDGNWMIVQRRQDGTENFYRDWKNYKNGFGDMTAEFFIGLDRLHELTQSRAHELWIKLQDWNNETRSAKYSKFAILGKTYDYKIQTLGKYSGNAGDSLSEHYGQKFTTKDQDNDNHKTRNCAVDKQGAWWFNKCGNSHLNGIYYKIDALPSINYAKGVFWNTWPGPLNSAKYAHMAIRPVE